LRKVPAVTGGEQESGQRHPFYEGKKKSADLKLPRCEGRRGGKALFSQKGEKNTGKTIKRPGKEEDSRNRSESQERRPARTKEGSLRLSSKKGRGKVKNLP